MCVWSYHLCSLGCKNKDCYCWPGILCQLFYNYFSDCKQCVHFNGFFLNVTDRVLQGSDLGPKLFTICPFLQWCFFVVLTNNMDFCHVSLCGRQVAPKCSMCGNRVEQLYCWRLIKSKNTRCKTTKSPSHGRAEGSNSTPKQQKHTQLSGTYSTTNWGTLRP